MTTSDVTSLYEADDELLSSYLDQELSPDERRALEKRLVDDDKLRSRLAEMRRAWDLLDELPETPFTPNFTQSTLEMVAIDLEKEKEAGPAWFHRWLPPAWQRIPSRLRLLTLVLAALLLGSAVGLLLRARYRTLEAHQIAVASRYATLEDFPDLKALAPLKELTDWKSLLELEGIRDRILTILPTGDSPETIQEYTNRLDAHQKELLWNQWQSVQQLTAGKRAEIDRRYQASLLASQTDSELQSLAFALNGLLQMLPSNRRAEIRVLPEDRKLAVLKQEAYFLIAKNYGHKLTAKEKDHIQDWKQRELIPHLRANSLYIPDQYFSSEWLIASFSSRQGSVSISEQGALIDALCQGLRPETAKIVQGLSEFDQLAIIPYWAIDRRLERNRSYTVEELYTQYENMDDVRKDELDLKRPEDARRDLERREMRARRNLLPERSGPPGPPGPGERLGPGSSGDAPRGFGPPGNRPLPPPLGERFPPRPGDRPFPPFGEGRGGTEPRDGRRFPDRSPAEAGNPPLPVNPR
jgi:hypothetical protein